VSSENKFDLVDWLTFKRRLDFSKARWLGPLVAVVASLLVVLAVGAAFALLLGALFWGLLDVPGSSLGVGGVTVALIGAPFVIWRSIVAQKQADIAEQGQITDRINKAVEGLGAEKEVNRIGRPVTIYCGQVKRVTHVGTPRDKLKTPPLSQIGEAYWEPHYNEENDEVKERIHIPVATWDDSRTEIQWKGESIYLGHDEVIGETGNWQVFTESVPNLEVRVGAIHALERIMEDSSRDQLNIRKIAARYVLENSEANETKEVKFASADVLAALSSLFRHDDPFLDLKFSNPLALELRSLCLEGRQVMGARIHFARLNVANLKRSIFFESEFAQSNLRAIDLSDAQFRHWKFRSCYFRVPRFTQKTRFINTKFSGCALRDFDYNDAPEGFPEAEQFFADKSVSGVSHRPDFWPLFELTEKEFFAEWRKWQADPDNYSPPDPPDADT
jgi:uncharacterized protein YjbI with pentapeptide repeats